MPLSWGNKFSFDRAECLDEKKILSIAWFSSRHYSVSCESVLVDDISEPHRTTRAWAVTALLSLGGSPGRGGMVHWMRCHDRA